MTTFPTWMTGPNGARRVFDCAEDVPEGWYDGLHPARRMVPRVREDGTREMVLQAEIDAVRGEEDSELAGGEKPESKRRR